MSEKGLAVAPLGTTSAPKTMYIEVPPEERDENVARGCVRVIEIIAYDYIGKKKDEDGRILTDTKGNPIIIDKGRAPYFCQTAEQEFAFKSNNPDVRIETFTIQLQKPTARKLIDSPRNVEAFVEFCSSKFCKEDK